MRKNQQKSAPDLCQDPCALYMPGALLCQEHFCFGSIGISTPGVSRCRSCARRLCSNRRSFSAPAAPLPRLGQGCLLRFPGTAPARFICLCRSFFCPSGYDSQSARRAPDRLRFSVKILAVGPGARCTRLGMQTAFSCLCTIAPIFFVCNERPAHGSFYLSVQE